MQAPLISPPGPASQLLKPSAEAAGISLSWPPVLRAGASQRPLQDSTFLLNDGKQVCWRLSLAYSASPTDQDSLPLSTWPGTLQTHELQIRKLLWKHTCCWHPRSCKTPGAVAFQDTSRRAEHPWFCGGTSLSRGWGVCPVPASHLLLSPLVSIPDLTALIWETLWLLPKELIIRLTR